MMFIPQVALYTASRNPQDPVGVTENGGFWEALSQLNRC